MEARGHSASRAELWRSTGPLLRACLSALGPPQSRAEAWRLALARLEALSVLFRGSPGREEVVRHCYGMLLPRLIAHEEEGEVVAGGTGEGDSAWQLRQPQRVACAADGSLLVADFGNGRISRWRGGVGEVLASSAAGSDFTYAVCSAPDGGVLATTDDAVEWLSLSGEPHPRAERLRAATVAAGLRDPCGLCADGSGSVLVADHLNHRVLRFPQSGGMEVVLGVGAAGPARQVPTPLGVGATGAVRLDCPADCEWHGGALLVADRGSGRVLRLHGGAVHELATGLLQPYAIACAGDLLYIAEFGCSRVLRAKLGCAGPCEHFVDVVRPTGLCFDAAWNLYVAERDRHRVLRFAPIVD